MQEPVIKYIEAGREDLETAALLLKNKMDFYVPYLCHQALHKVLRGYFLECLNRYPPLTNDLLAIADDTEAGLMMDGTTREFVGALSIMPEVVGNPVYRTKILKMIRDEKGVEILAKTQNVFEMIKKLI